MEYQEELDDEVYDEIMYPPSVRGRTETGHYSQWGPKRPRHTMTYPKRRPSKFEAYWRCVCHQLSMTCIVLLILVALLALAVVMVILAYYAQGHFNQHQGNNVDYGPGDTQSLFFSAIFCDTLAISNESILHEGYQESGLYLLKEPPSLTAIKEVKFDVVVSEDSYQHNFHLFKGSTISVKACVESSDSDDVGSFYLVKGKSTWENAKENINKNSSVEYLSIKTVCHMEFASTNYIVPEEDQYFLCFVNGQNTVPINATVTIQRKLYALDNSSVISQCKFKTEPCSIDLPFQPRSSVLLTYGRPDNWEDSPSTLTIKVSCKQRAWVYVMLIIIGLLIIGAGTCVGCMACWWCSYSLHKRDSAEQPLLSARTGTLYSNAVPSSNEMSNPSKYRWSSYKDTEDSDEYPESSTRKSQAPGDYRPPSFKERSYEPGTASYDTFTKK